MKTGKGFTKKRVFGLICAAVLGSLALTACSGEVVDSQTDGDQSTSETEAALSGTLKFAGSSSMEKVVAALGEAFKEKHSGVTVTIDQQGSGSAIPALKDGTAHVGNLSREVKDEENSGGEYTVIEIAIDGIAVIVHPDNAVADLTLDQIAKIFKGEVKNWKDVGGADQTIYVVGREEGSGTRDGFEEIVGAKGKCKYGIQLKETGDVVSKVAAEKAAIGYVSYASVSSTTKALKVGGVEVKESTIADKSYAIQRPFVQAYRKDTQDELILAYLDFLKSAEGQQIVQDEKLIPVEFWK